MKKKRQKPASPNRAVPVVSSPTRGVANLDLHESIRILVAGVITGIAVTVLYQNATGRQAGGIVYSAAPPAIESAHLPTIVRSPQAPASAAHGAEQAVSAKLLPGPGLPLPVLPPPKLTPIRLHESEPSGVQIKGINPAKARQAEQTIAQTIEQEDDGSGVHVEIRSKKTPPPDILPALTPATSTTTAPAPAPATPAIAPSPEKTAGPDKPPQVSPKPLVTKPLQLEPASDAPIVQEKVSPKFTVIERQADGELIRVGNQVRFIGAGASLPDGTKVSAGK